MHSQLKSHLTKSQLYYYLFMALVGCCIGVVFNWSANLIRLNVEWASFIFIFALISILIPFDFKQSAPTYDRYLLMANPRDKAIEQKKLLLRKKLEEKLTSKLFFEDTRDGIFIMDAQRQVLDTNDAFVRMLGYNFRSEVIGLFSYDFDAETDTKEKLETQWKRLPDNEIMTKKIRCKNGDIIYGEVSFNKVTFEGQSYLFNICRNITTNKVYLDELKAQNDRLQKILLRETSILRSHLDSIKLHPEYHRIRGTDLENEIFPLSESLHLLESELQKDFLKG